ncbi:cytochrome c oxidase subunit II [Aquabacterium sp.]|uniref:cytochrome c oxidase subunit II n=1 Tax=Aquabacterium sp. TaxID=1872578 RepID=UPI003D6CEBD6
MKAPISIHLLMFGLLLALPGWAGVDPPQDILRPAGPQAHHLLNLWHTMLVVCTLVFAAVLAVLVVVLWRRPRADSQASPDLALAASPERGSVQKVGAAVVASTLLLIFLIVASLLTDRALARLSLKDAVHIEVTANQWWWDVRYDHAQADQVFYTANELHIPVGRPVIFTLKSGDVIHSLWVPNLHGKKDLIPGRTSTLQLQADRPGIYRGQCAEFCGYQHAFMALRIIADPPDQYEAWAAQQRQSAGEPSDERLRRGRDIFLSTTCVMCHTVQGTTASARRGPDLTHLAGRKTLAAGTLANTPDDLARWIQDPQQFKPGVNMPASKLSDDDLKALVAYLGSLT